MLQYVGNAGGVSGHGFECDAEGILNIICGDMKVVGPRGLMTKAEKDPIDMVEIGAMNHCKPGGAGVDIRSSFGWGMW